MSEPNARPACDTCGKPATSAAVDALHRPDPTGTYWQAEPIGRHRFGCDEHPAESKDYYYEGGRQP